MIITYLRPCILQESNNLAFLYRCQVKGRPEVVEALLDAGADADAATLKGNTPLLFAANAGNCECARMLIQRGARVNAQNKSDGDTGLHRCGRRPANRSCVCGHLSNLKMRWRIWSCACLFLISTRLTAEIPVWC